MIVNIIDTLLGAIEEMNITETEVILIRGIIAMNSDARGLSDHGKTLINNVRDQLHNALYQECSEHSSEAPLRFANLLHLLPKITVSYSTSSIIIN